MRVAVSLAEDGVISREDAICRIEPRALAELLHPQVDPRSTREVLASGIAASPGAASGLVALSPASAQAMEARGEAAVLVRRETSPEDVRGMHAACAILTERGGASSHAAVIARGLGLPCVVGASGLVIEADGVRAGARRLAEGDPITVDGTRGEALAGHVPLLAAAPGGAMATAAFMGRRGARHRRARQRRHAARTRSWPARSAPRGSGSAAPSTWCSRTTG